MRIIKSFFIAFSMYSKIPMPQFEWKDEDMRYALCFFPWVGAVIGVLWYLWKWICVRFGVGTLCYTVVGTAIPILITGGFHVDGFLDTCDALHSYQPRERKLEILKDSHAGAFAVITAAVYFVTWYGAYSQLYGSENMKAIEILSLGFMVSRCLSGIGVITFPKAKSDGTVAEFSRNSSDMTSRNILVVYLILLAAAMIRIQPVWGIAAFAGALLIFAYYHHMAMKYFGGTTGDLSGFFLCICEVGMAVLLAVVSNLIVR